MRNWLFGFSAGLLMAGLGFAQPCTLVWVEPLRWPEGVPTDDIRLDNLGYAMGVYTLSVVEAPLSGKAAKAWPVVSADGRNWRLARLSLQHPRRPDRDEITGLLAPVYAQGFWLSLFSDGDWVLRSEDGLHWQEVDYGFDPTIGYHHTGGLFWDGKQFLKIGFWGGVWASPDGRNFQRLGAAPNLYPIRWAAVNHLGGIVTDLKEGAYATRDFQHWHAVPLNFGPSVGVVNGWFDIFGNVGSDRYDPIYRVARSRDGRSFRFVNAQGWPGSPTPIETRIAGVSYVIWGQSDATRKTPGYLRFSGRRARAAVPERALTFEPNADLGQIDVGLLGKQTTVTFDGSSMILVGGAFSSGPASRLRLLGFSCADLGGPLVLPGMAHQDGALNTRWRSDLILHYPGAGGSEVRVEWLPYGQANEDPRFVRLWLNAGETKVVNDVVATLFQAEGNGAIRVVWLGEERGFARGRTYNETASGTFGQAVEGFGWEDGVDRCYVPENESDDPNNEPSSWQNEEEMWLVGLADSGNDANGFRTNVGLQNLWRNEAEVEVVWMGANGRELGRRQVHLRAFEGVQWFRPLRELGLGPLEGVTAVVRVLTGDTRVAAYASVVDNRTGDGVYVRGRKDLVQGLTPFPWEREGTTMVQPKAGSSAARLDLTKPKEHAVLSGKALAGAGGVKSTP